MARKNGYVRNAPNVMDGRLLLQSLRGINAKAVFLDPQYRGLLDQMKYGNEGVAYGYQRTQLPQMTDEVVTDFVRRSGMALAPNGYLFMWVDKHAIGSGLHLKYVSTSATLKVVDLIHWNKTVMGMGYRTRCQSEYLVVIQKEPRAAGKTWKDRTMIDAHIEGVDRSRHVHTKPYQLIERLIRAVTKRGDVVVDPCAGSYIVLDACKATGRVFVGADLIPYGG